MTPGGRPIGETASIADGWVDDAARWYARPRVPVEFADLPPILLRHAARLCGGDWRRCVRRPAPPGSVLPVDVIDVHNRPMWTPTPRRGV